MISSKLLCGGLLARLTFLFVVMGGGGKRFLNMENSIAA